MAIKLNRFTSNNLNSNRFFVIGILLSLCISTNLIAQTDSRKSKNPGKPKPDIEIIAGTENDKRRFKLGESIVITLNVNNNDDSDIYIPQSCVSLDYKLLVKNEQEHLISLTQEGRRLTNRNEVICSLRKVRIRPGDAAQANLNLSLLYDLSAKGTYYITASRSAKKNDNNWIQATSKAIQIVVD